MVPNDRGLPFSISDHSFYSDRNRRTKSGFSMTHQSHDSYGMTHQSYDSSYLESVSRSIRSRRSIFSITSSSCTKNFSTTFLSRFNLLGNLIYSYLDYDSQSMTHSLFMFYRKVHFILWASMLWNINWSCTYYIPI